MTVQTSKATRRQQFRLGRTKRARVGYAALKDGSLNGVVVTSFE